MRKAQIIGLLIITVLLILAIVVGSFALSPAFKATAAPEATNVVNVDFNTGYIYEVPGDVFINKEVTGKAEWHTRMDNMPDDTGEPVSDYKVTLVSDLAFDGFSRNGLITVGPPTYEWFYGDVPQHSRMGLPWTPDSVVWFESPDRFPGRFTPGFDASCTVDKNVFTAPDTQTVTITITPREEHLIDHLYVEVVAIEHEAVNPSVSQVSQQEIDLSPDGHILGIEPKNLEFNTPWSINVTLQITPKVTKLEYRPGVSILCVGFPNVSSGVTRGSSFSYTNEAGEWTVSAEGNYVWDWDVGPYGETVTFDRIVNAAPQLMEGKVTATAGLMKETLNFEVTYADDASPSYVRLYVDDVSYDMNYVRGVEALVFSYTTNLSPGQHTYYFEASDGSLIARFPQDGTLTIEVTGQRFFIWIIVGAVAAGLGIYFFRRRRRRVA